MGTANGRANGPKGLQGTIQVVDSGSLVSRPFRGVRLWKQSSLWNQSIEVEVRVKSWGQWHRV
jgi:hypothetical protein